MPDYIDPNRPGPRNDRMQRLQNKYLDICKTEGLTARPQIVGSLERLDGKGVQVRLEQISGLVVDLSHRVAHHALESPEFRPLVLWFVEMGRDGDEKKMRIRLEDMGALTYQRAVREGQ